MTINRFYASLIPRPPSLRSLWQLLQRQRIPPPPQQKPAPADQLYALALAVVEQYRLD